MTCLGWLRFGATPGCLLSAPPFLPSCIVVVTCTRARELCRCKVVHAPCEAPEGVGTCSHIFLRVSAPRRCLQAEGPLQGSPRSSPRSTPRVACRGGGHRRENLFQKQIGTLAGVQENQGNQENPATFRKPRDLEAADGRGTSDTLASRRPTDGPARRSGEARARSWQR